MPAIPIISSFWNFLTVPTFPRTALVISESRLTVTSLRARRREYLPQNLATTRLPAGLVRQHFSEPNITDEGSFIEKIEQTLEEAGLKRLHRLAVGLPEGSARSQVISLESTPSTRAELDQMLAWKIERRTGAKFDELRIAHRQLSPLNGHPQFLSVLVHREVIEQYERIFKSSGLQVGLILPHHLCEAQWLMRRPDGVDRALLSLTDRGFIVVIIRGAEPIMIREVICHPHDREDEFYRLMIFYRDRLLPEGGGVQLRQLLIIGEDADREKFRQTLNSALETEVELLGPPQLGLRLETPLLFSQVAAASGLALLGCGR